MLGLRHMSAGQSKTPRDGVWTRRARWLGARAVTALLMLGWPRLAITLAVILFPELRTQHLIRARREQRAERIVHVFEPQLHDGAGHYLNFDTAIFEQVSRHPGWGCLFYGQLDVSDDVRRTLPAHPFFVKSARWGVGEADGAVDKDPNDADPEGKRRNARRARRWKEFNHPRLLAIDGELIRDCDVVMFPTLRTQSMSAMIADWLRCRPRAGRPLLVIHFMFSDYLAGAGTRLSEDYAQLFHALAEYPAERRVLITETREIQHDLLRLSGHRVPIELAPHFQPKDTLEPLLEARTKAERSGPRCIGFAGHSRGYRGAHLVPDVVASVSERAPSAVRFRIHVQEQVWSAMDTRPLRGRPNVELFEGTLSTDEYYALLASMDVMLLPFKPGVRTSWQGSGVFTESLALGLVTVVPRNSLFAREADLIGAGFTAFEEWNPSAIADAVLEALRDFDRLEARSRAAAARWLSERSLSSFFDRVLAPPPL